MEIVYYNKESNIISNNKITGFYGDVLDLINLGIEIEGIIYDDAWTVERFLKGSIFKNNKRIDSVLKYLEIDSKLKNIKLGYLSKTDFKFVLLAKALLMNKNNIVFDYFDVGLTFKEQKRLIRIIRTLKKDGKTIVVLSNDLVFMNSIIDIIIVIKNGDISFEGSINDLIKSNEVDDPEIIKFIKLANKKGAKLDYTLDSKELLKDIYRSEY